MDSRQLRHFVNVVDHGGFTAAARAVFVSQPALSLAVKELEAELGVDLFARVGRRVQLTAAGTALVGPARAVLRDLETAQAAVAAVAGLVAGRLTLASLPTLAVDPLAALVGAFRQRYPGVEIDLAAPEGGRELVDLVMSGHSEIGLTDAVDVPEPLVAVALGVQSLAFILPPDTEVETAGALDRTLFVAAPAGTSTRRLLDERLGGPLPRVAVTAAQREAILPLVLAGAGAALVPEALARVAERLGAVVLRPDPPAVRRLALVHRPGPLSPAAARFTEMATEGPGDPGLSPPSPGIDRPPRR
jgi:LysR family transcriptional regulator, carnitine catabolism transcriptional activator